MKKIFALLSLTLAVFFQSQSMEEHVVFSTEQEYEQFKQCMQIGNLLIEIIKKRQNQGWHLPVEDGRKAWPGSNPFYNQTEQGFFLEFSYGRPSRLWTPWGEVKLEHTLPCFYRSVKEGWNKVSLEFMDNLDTELYRKKSLGYDGSVYKILKIKEISLPQSKEQNQKNYKKYEEINSKWAILEKRYNEENAKILNTK